jgi:hypothetical protein
MEHAHQIICTHNTPDVTHKLGQVQAKVLCPHPSPCIVSSLLEEPLNKSVGHENLFFYETIFYMGGRGIVYFI